ncbi:hypothetical protein BDP27DRAFT_1285119 [Rhodocollybia butyracea]|uniref:Uncharacterized protein n=1 Tax=Rhodocollybia butyracea TaxID=206335 RepID=A0A9P5Q7H6_9AGAR|nr:hypothetical protein BDP27DRAFT_1285119 [Rhodocollybia butyracea]
MSSPLLWRAFSSTAKSITVAQILLFLPLTLATLSTPAFLLLSLCLAIHSVVHGTMVLLEIPNLTFLQVPIHPFLLLLCFNVFSSNVNPWIMTAARLWGNTLSLWGPFFVLLEGLSSLIVAQRLGQLGKRRIEQADTEISQFTLLVASAAAYVTSAWWIVSSYPAAASSPLSSTFLGVALTALVFLTFIGFVLRKTNIIESSALSLFIAYNVWLCGADQNQPFFLDTASSYLPLIGNLKPHFEALQNFVTNTLPKPVLITLFYRLTILHVASRILPTIGADSWESETGVDNRWDDRPTSTLTRILLTYRQLLFVTVYSHLLLLDHSSQVWWRWINIFFTLIMWGIELLVSADNDAVKDWKVE